MGWRVHSHDYEEEVDQMSLSQEAHEFNEQQKRYRENEHLHKYTAGADHRELMDELKRLNNSIGCLLYTSPSPRD